MPKTAVWLLCPLLLPGCFSQIAAEEGAACNDAQLCASGLRCGPDNLCIDEQAPDPEEEGTTEEEGQEQEGQESEGQAVEGEGEGAGPPTGGVIEQRLPHSVVQPRGLAHEGRSFWTTTATSPPRLLRLGDDGAQTEEHELPVTDAAVLGLARVADQLFLAFAARTHLYSFTLADDQFREVTTGPTLTGLASLTATPTQLVTLQDRVLYLRDPVTLAVAAGDARAVEQAGQPVVWYEGWFLLFRKSEQDPPGSGPYRLTLDVVRGDRADLAPRAGTLELPVDLSVVTGLATANGLLWIVGAGYGTEVGQLVGVQLE